MHWASDHSFYRFGFLEISHYYRVFEKKKKQVHTPQSSGASGQLKTLLYLALSGMYLDNSSLFLEIASWS